jgi:hypothetical protein
MGTLYRALELFNLTEGRLINETSAHLALIALGVLPDVFTVEISNALTLWVVHGLRTSAVHRD